MLTYGPTIPEKNFDYNIFQGVEPTCAIRSQEIILRDFGIQIPQEELKQYASHMGWYDEGTPEEAIGNLLETCNVSTHTAHCDSVYDIINELKDGHRVIVTLDSHEIWAEPGSFEYEFYKLIPNPDHALIVSSICIDPDNPESSKVILTDPGSGSILEYDIERFAHAWGDSNCYMMATDEPAPYQYNPETQTMEMSNFATDYAIQEFPFHNEFSNIWQVAEVGYVPYYDEGHLDYVTDNLSYDDFTAHYEENDFDFLNDLFGFNDINWDNFMHVLWG
jgi:hypothetical protein